MSNPLEGFSAPRKIKMPLGWKIAAVITSILIGVVCAVLVQPWLAGH